MIQQIAHRDFVLAGLGELRPVAGDGDIEIESALIDQAMRANGGQTLGGRKNIDDRVANPWTCARFVRMSPPEVHHRSAVKRYRDRRAIFIARGKIFGESRSHGLETWLTATFYANVGHTELLVS